MFTGLIESIGTVTALTRHPDGGSTVTIESAELAASLALGDSIAVDGACTTVVACTENGFTFEATPETLRKTQFHTFQPGVRVNLERPLTPVSRIGGHYVTGHVDGLARLQSRAVEGNAVVMTFEVENDDLASYLVPKGSVTVSGISLTVNKVTDRRFTVAIIPHTLAHTTLADREIGDPVNIETDLLGKYVKKFLDSVLNHMTGDTIPLLALSSLPPVVAP